MSAMCPCLFGPRQIWQSCICALPFLLSTHSASSGCLCTYHFPTFLALGTSGLVWKSKFRYVWICHCDQDQNPPSLFCFSPSILHLNLWFSGAEAGNGERLNQEWEKLTALAVTCSFFFLPSSIGTVLNYTKIACKTLINLICSNAAFTHESFTVTQVNNATCFRRSGALILFIQPKVHWFAWSLSPSFLSFKNYIKKKSHNHFFTEESKTGIFREQLFAGCPAKERKVSNSAFLHSSFFSLSTHKDTQTSSRHSWSNIANKAASLAQCATKSNSTCL